MWNPVQFTCHLYSSFLSSGWHYNHIHTFRRCIYFLWLMWWVNVRIYRSKHPPSFVVLGTTVVKKTTFVLLFSSKYVSGGFSLFYWIPCILICRCPIAPLLNFCGCFLMIPSMRPVQVLRKPCLIALRRLDVVGMKSAAWRYCASSGLVVWAIISFPKISDCFVSRGT